MIGLLNNLLIGYVVMREINSPSFLLRKRGVIMRKRNDFYTSELECPVCHRKFPIQRKAAEKRERGHIKDIWCPFCKKKRKFIENGDG